MKLKFVSELIQIASLRFIEALEGSKITPWDLYSQRYGLGDSLPAQPAKEVC